MKTVSWTVALVYFLLFYLLIFCLLILANLLRFCLLAELAFFREFHFSWKF